MKNVVLLFDTACIYEIVILNYFLKYAGQEVVFCSVDGKSITSMEGYSVNIDLKLSEINIDNVRSIIVPGGNVSSIKNDKVYEFLRKIKNREKIIAGICAGVDVLDESGTYNISNIDIFLMNLESYWLWKKRSAFSVSHGGIDC